MKEYKKIEALLERYYNAQTSEAEEQQLKDFFLTEEVPPHLQNEKKFFLQLQANQLKERLENQINQWEVEERIKPKFDLKKPLLWMGSIAASILIIFYIGINQSPQPRQDTCNTPEEAYIHTEKTLMMFAQALNKGISQMENIQETTNKIEKKVQEQFNKLNN